MEVQRSTQSVHPAGRAGLDFLSSKKVLTCGQEGCVRVVTLDPLEDSGMTCHDDGRRQFVRIAVNPLDKKTFALAKEEDGFNSFVQLYSFADIEQTETAEPGPRMTQTTLGICDLAWSKDGSWIAVATDSDGIKIMKVADPVASIRYLKDHQGAVKGVAFDPLGEYLASVGADGALRIYSLKNDTWTCVKSKISFCERDNATGSPTMEDCKPSWSENGAMLALPGAGALRVLKRGDWDEEIEFESAAFNSAITLTAFSSSYLAACCGGEQSQVFVWNLKTRKIAYAFEDFDRTFFRSMAFQPDVECIRLVGLNSDGELVQFELPRLVSAKAEVPNSLLSVAPSVPIHGLTSQELGDSQAQQPSQDSQIDYGEDEITQIPASQEESTDKPLASSSVTTSNNDNNGIKEDEENDPNSSVLRIKQDLGFNEEGQFVGGGDGMIGDSADPTFARISAVYRKQEEAVADMRQDIDSIRRMIDRLKPPASHETFQPGSTQFGSSFERQEDENGDVVRDDPLEDTDRRFLAWNNVGTIVCRRDQDKQSIEVDFADSAVHRPVRISDFNFFDRAALSESGAFFSSTASDGSQQHLDMDEENNPVDSEHRDAVLHYRSFAAPPWNYNWTFTLSKKESIVAIACGNTFCAAASKRGFLRVFRPSGLQEPISTLPGPVLSMVASGSLLLVLYHSSHRRIDHELSYQLLDFGNEGDADIGRVLASGPLPCEQGALWCGFADESLGFMPLVYRRDGVLLGLSARAQWTWTVLSDGTGLERGTRLWPISASREGGLLAVALRHKRKQPSVIPRSTPALFAIKIPILREKNKQQAIKYDQEEVALHDSLVLLQRKWAGLETEDDLMRAQAMADIATLRAMVVAIKLKEYARAFGLASRLRMAKSLDVAMDKATEAGADQAFLERLVGLIDERAKAEAEQAAAEEAEAYTASSRVSSSQAYSQPRGGYAEETEDQVVEPSEMNRVDYNDDEDEDDVRSVQNLKQNPSSMRVTFDGTPKKRARMSQNNDEEDVSSPFVDSTKKKSIPKNPFSKSASPAARDKRPQHRVSPIRIPELSRQASFTVEARSDHKRKI